MEPDYVAKKSAWAVWSFGTVLLCFLILPVIVQILRTITVKRYRIEFYHDRIVVKSGLLSTHTRQTVFMGIFSVSIRQTLWGRLFVYGDVSIDCVGKWDIDTTYIVDPGSLEEYLLTRIVQHPNTTAVVPM